MGMPSFGSIDGFVDEINERSSRGGGNFAFVKVIVAPSDRDKHGQWNDKGDPIWFDLFIYDKHPDYEFVVDQFQPEELDNGKKRRRAIYMSDVGFYLEKVEGRNGKTYLNHRLHSYPWSQFSDQPIKRDNAKRQAPVGDRQSERSSVTGDLEEDDI